MPRPSRERSTALDPRRAATRERVVAQATKLFSHYGFRHTSVDAVAAAAGVAKPTLYTYFEDKDALFVAVCQHVLDGILAHAEEAAARETTLEARMTDVLAAKFTRLFELVDASPHAAELLGSGSRVAADLVADADRRFDALLRKILTAAVDAGELDPASVGLSVGRLALALLRCGHGASYRATTVAEHRANLAELVRVVVLAACPRRR